MRDFEQFTCCRRRYWLVEVTKLLLKNAPRGHKSAWNAVALIPGAKGAPRLRVIVPTASELWRPVNSFQGITLRTTGSFPKFGRFHNSHAEIS
jgi:hypothetical protein